jgi:hypothetical protein
VDNTDTKKRLGGVPDAVPERERRRIGTVVHDERGNASVHWREAPVDKDMERPPLEVLDNPGLTLKPEDIYDPYARGKPRSGMRHGARPTGPGARTDLRKLSEHIKLMRELEERKRRGEDSED